MDNEETERLDQEAAPASGETAPGPGETAPGSGAPSDPPPPPPPSSAPPPPSGPPASYAPSAHVSGIPSESRNWAMGAHLSAFVGAWVALAFVGPLVIWLIRRDQGDAFAEHHAKEALNFNLSMLVYLVGGAIIGGILTVVTLGIGLIVLAPVALALVVGWVVLTILAAVKASNGEGYRYPLTIRFVS